MQLKNSFQKNKNFKRAHVAGGCHVGQLGCGFRFRLPPGVRACTSPPLAGGQSTGQPEAAAGTEGHQNRCSQCLIRSRLPGHLVGVWSHPGTTIPHLVPPSYPPVSGFPGGALSFPKMSWVVDPQTTRGCGCQPPSSQKSACNPDSPRTQTPLLCYCPETLPVAQTGEEHRLYYSKLEERKYHHENHEE